MSKIISCIGAREIEDEVKILLRKVGKHVSESGYAVRSGGSSGSDLSFAEGVKQANGKLIEYLPWKGFNGNDSQYYNILPEAYEIARLNHPQWERCSKAARKLLARNVHILLGESLDKPSEFVLAWMPKETGGTRHTARIARDYNIRVYNLCDHSVNDIMRAIGG